MRNNITKIYAGMNYSTKQINSNFKMKVSGVDANGNKLHKAVDVKGLVELIGAEFASKMVKRAFANMDDKCVCKLRRGIVVTFYRY